MFNTPKYLKKPLSQKHGHLIFKTGTTKTGSVVTLDWNEFTYGMQMACHQTIDKKINATLFTPWSPKSNSFGRTKDCVESTALIVFDLDKIETMDVELVSNWCLPYANFVHTTYSHGIDNKGCFRVYIPMDKPIPIELYQKTHSEILSHLPEIQSRVDLSSSDIARCFFMPSCPPSTKQLSGYAMNLLGIHAITPKIDNAAYKKDFRSDSIEPSLLGNRNNGLASYAGKAYKKGLTPDEFMDDAIRWGFACTPPMDLSEIESVVNSMWQIHTRNNPTLKATHIKTKYLRSAEDLKNDPPLEWTVRGVLPNNGIGAVYGSPSSGKTFLALDLAFSIATGIDWFANPTLQKPVAYIALEGSHGIRQRIKAWEKATQTVVPKNFMFITAPVSIEDDQGWQDVADEIRTTLGAGTVVMIDTLNRASPTADENSPAAMGKIIDSAKKMADEINGFVLFIHHSGKDASKGLRGHSSLLAALDTVIKVSNSNNQRIWSIEKSKDSEIGISSAFDLKIIPLDSQDSWGITHTSCIVSKSLLKIAAKPLRGKNQQQVMRTVAKLLLDNPTKKITLQELEAQVAKNLNIGDPKRATERAKIAINSLLLSNHIDLVNGFVIAN